MAFKHTILKPSATQESTGALNGSNSPRGVPALRRCVKKVSKDPLTFVLLVWVLAFMVVGFGLVLIE